MWIGILLYFTLLIGLRYKVGGDTINYMGDYYWRVPLSQWKYSVLDKFQPGYTLLCALGKSISPDFYVLQLLHSLILNCAIGIWIYKNTKYIFTSFMAFYLSSYLYFSTEILREALAIMVFLFNYKNIEKKSWIKYYLGVIISCCFHLSAVILFILPFLKKVQFNKTYILLMICALIGSILSIRVIQSLSTIIVLAEKAEGYVGVTTGMMAGGYKLMITTIFPICFGYIATYKRTREIKFEWMIGIMGLLGIMALFNSIIFGRFSNYFILFFCVSFGTTIIQWFKTQSQILRNNAFIFSLCFIILFGIGFKMYNKYTLWVPYYSIYNPTDINREYADKMLLNR